MEEAVVQTPNNFTKMLKRKKGRPPNPCARSEQEDGRKRPRAAFQASRLEPTNDDASSDEGPSSPPSMIQNVRQLYQTHHGNFDSQDNKSRDSYDTFYYYRELGPTAIIPGHKQVAVEVRQKLSPVNAPRPSVSSSNLPRYLFDEASSLPVQALLDKLIDVFFHYYADSFCFLNRGHLEHLLGRGKASPFLVCSIAALSSRFCDKQLIEYYYPLIEGGRCREPWEYSIPFLERAETLMTPLLGIPSHDVVAGMAMLALVEFGNNSEASKF